MKFLFPLLLLAVPLSVASLPSHEDLAIQQLSHSLELLNQGDTDGAALLNLEVLKTKGLSDKVMGTAFLLFGNISIASGRLSVAKIAYQHVILLPTAPHQEKEAAELAILIIDRLQEQPPTHSTL